MIINLKDNKEFKKENLNSWIDNSNFWLYKAIIDKNVQNNILNLINTVDSSNQNKVIVDLGCGNGWLLQNLITKNKKFKKYIGIDFNYKFIEFLNRKYSMKFCEFKCLDIEKEIPDYLSNCADIIINCLNLIETPDLNKVFNNMARIAKKDSQIIIISLNPIIELIRDSKNFEDLTKNLAIYELAREKTVICKKINVRDEVSKSNYYRILYSFQDYLNAGNDINFKLINFVNFYGSNNIKKNSLFELYEFKKL